ncbi:LOW QUALITY PROTEIN: putative gametogenetin-binding protein 1 [Callithrix jacchus]|uniref:LOW QUALITY PROTEIN: putative gametogenetin-binding protein 1 n=1 Tax=Callithrix jacchus TaxID=9483 RepID=UPI0023DD2044|nr:LOW QUALITY PROTEIN: putative gametogenetin-binding protein 1 [Callithrix jacchus]
MGPWVPSRLLPPPPACPLPSLWLSGFLESELKKLLGMQQESRLWKLGGQEGQELLTWPEITLKEWGGSGVQSRLRHVHSPISAPQCLFFEEKDEMGNWPRVFPAQIPGAGTQGSISS